MHNFYWWIVLLYNLALTVIAIVIDVIAIDSIGMMHDSEFYVL